MGQYERGGQISFDNLSSSLSSDQNTPSKIQGRKFILRYKTLIGVDFPSIQLWLQQESGDLDLKVIKSSWSANTQMLLIIFGKRKKLSLRKWRDRLSMNNQEPRFVLYEHMIYQAYMTEYSFHWPERYCSKLSKLLNKTKTIQDFVEENVIQLKNLTKLNENIEFYQNIKLERTLKCLKYEKKRGCWFYGLANSGKTTFAMKYFNQEPIYYKDMTTQTFDHYKGQVNIFLDEMNIQNSKKLLPILKNLVNCVPGRFNVKFGTRMIYPKKVIVTTQYPLNMLTKDQALIAAIKQRFYFYYAQRFQQYTKVTEFEHFPNDKKNPVEMVYDLKINQIISYLNYFAYQTSQIDQIQARNIKEE